MAIFKDMELTSVILKGLSVANIDETGSPIAKIMSDEGSILGTIKAKLSTSQLSVEDIVFGHDLSLVGDYTLGLKKKTPDETYVVSAGTTLYEMLSTLFTGKKPDIQPEIVANPSLTLYFAGRDVEVGTMIEQLTCKTLFNEGSYTYEPNPPGVSCTLSVMDNNGVILPVQNNTQLTVHQTLSSDSKWTYKLSGVAVYTDGKIAKTRNGYDSDPVVQIKAGTIVKENKINFKHGYFYGGLDPEDTLADPTKITSDQIRSLYSTSRAGKTMLDYSAKLFAPTDCTQLFFAFQKDELKNVSKVYLKASDMEDADLTDNFEMKVATANSSISADYRVYYTELDVGLGNSLEYNLSIIYNN